MKKFIVLYNHTRDTQTHWLKQSALAEEKTVDEINAMSEDDIETWIGEEQSTDDGWGDSDNGYMVFIVIAESEEEAKAQVSPFLFEQGYMTAYELANTDKN